MSFNGEVPSHEEIEKFFEDAILPSEEELEEQAWLDRERRASMYDPDYIAVEESSLFTKRLRALEINNELSALIMRLPGEIANIMEDMAKNRVDRRKDIYARIDWVIPRIQSIWPKDNIVRFLKDQHAWLIDFFTITGNMILKEKEPITEEEVRTITSFTYEVMLCFRNQIFRLFELEAQKLFVDQMAQVVNIA